MSSFKKPGPSADFEKVKVGRYLKEILILNSFTLEDKDPIFTRLKPGLALRLLSQGLLNRWTSQLDLGSTTEWLERVVSVHNST